MNLQKEIITLCILFLIMQSVGCSRPTPSPEIPPVVSLKENLPELEQVAKKWNPDAVLTRVSMRIDAPNSELLSAGFRTNSLQETLLLRLYRNGEIVSKILIESKKIEVSGIDKEDLKIDSTEVLELLLDEEENQYMKTENHRRCSNLVLEREPLLPGNPVIWSLGLWDCTTNKSEYRYINATTGEEVSVNK